MRRIVSFLFLWSLAAVPLQAGTALAAAAPLLAKAPAKAKKKSTGDKSGKSDNKGTPHSGGDVVLGKSAAAREHTQFMVVGEIALLDILHAGQGVEAGYQLSRDSLIELGYMRATFEFFTFKSTMTFINAQYHWFLGNSFYFYGGAGVRTLEATSLGFDSGVSTYQSTHSASHVMGEIGLGNRWQWDGGFVMGCDWVGYAFAVSELSRTSSYDPTPSATSQAEDDGDFGTRADAGNLVTVRFHLGMAF